MGKIFGISDLPVTIFTTPFESLRAPKPTNLETLKIFEQTNLKSDTIAISKKNIKTNFISRIVNGFVKRGK